jgi:cytidylate kinase
MPIITISRGSYSRGKEVAEKVASLMGYDCISREILLESSQEFNEPEIKLIRALHDSPTVLERFTHGKERYLCHIRKTLLKYVQKDNVVYHGLAGHYFLLNINHVFKVRIIADMKDRVREEVRRENITEDEALYTLKKDDDERRKWGLQVYGIDTWDSRLYDMVLHIGLLTVDDAADIICHAVRKPVFKATRESQQTIDDMLVAARVQVALMKLLPTARVECHQGVVTICDSKAIVLELKKEVLDQVKGIAENVEGVRQVIVLDGTDKGRSEMINPFHNI